MNKFIKTLVFTSMILLSIYMFSACGDSGKTLILGLDENFPPMGFRNKEGNTDGLDIDLAKEAAKRMNMKLQLRPIDWNELNEEIESGNIDCVWNGFSVTPERMEKFELTRPYMKNRQVSVVRIDSALHTLEDLHGKKAAVQSGSTAVSALNNSPINSFLKKVIEVSDNNQALLQLEQHKVDFVVCDEIFAGYTITTLQPGKFRILEETHGTEEFAVGFKKGNTSLRDKVQAALDEIIADGTAKNISEKWLGSNAIE